MQRPLLDVTAAEDEQGASTTGLGAGGWDRAAASDAGEVGEVEAGEIGEGEDEGEDHEEDEEAVGVVASSLERKPGVCGGVIDDMRRRCPLYGADLRNGLGLKTISSALFMFFATFTSTVALGVKIQTDLGGRLGVSEYLLMNSVAGMAHALLGCQPMLVLRPTGPITLILTLLSQLADGVFVVNYWQLLAWTGFFVALFMTVVAAFEVSRFISRLTRFTHEIFAFFVCSIYIEDGVSSVINRFAAATDAEFASSLFQACLAAATFGIAIWLHGARGWVCLGAGFRSFLADYAVTVAVVLASALSFSVPTLPELVQYVDVPAHFGPTCHFVPPSSSNASSHGSSNGGGVDGDIGNSSGVPTPECSADLDNTTLPTRPWLPELWSADTPALLPLYAAGCALLIIFFFFFDQNISSLYTQLPSKQLKHGSYYHSSFQWMGIFNAVGPLLGLPFVTGSLPHSPQFIHAVTVYEEVNSAGSDNDDGGGGGDEDDDDGDNDDDDRGGGGDTEAGAGAGAVSANASAEKVLVATGGTTGWRPSANHASRRRRRARVSRKETPVPAKELRIAAVYENRIAPFIMYALIGAALFVPTVIEVIPFGAVDGLLTFVGVAGLLECQLWSRILLLLRAPGEFPAGDKNKTPYLRGVSPCKMHLYTMIQLLLLAGCWAVNLSPAGLAFSLVVVGLVPFRIYVIPCWFTKRERMALDSPEKETYHSW